MGELDVKRRSGFLPLLEQARKTSGQVFMTATEENWPSELGKDLQRWEVQSRNVCRNFESADDAEIERQVFNICAISASAFLLTFFHANFVRHPAQRRAASRKLFRDDAARHRVAGKGRGVLFHRGLSFDDLAVRRGRTAQKHPGRGAGFSRVRPGPERIRFLQAIRRAGSDRTGVDAHHAHADGPAGTRATATKTKSPRALRQITACSPIRC